MDQKDVLFQQVSKALLDYIIQNQFKAGDRLPHESELASLFGVGRSTIREAIRELKGRNILDSRKGSGTYVAQDPGITDDPLGLVFIEDKKQLALDMLDMRMWLEPWIAAKAAVHATDEDIRHLRELEQTIEQQILAGENHQEKDIEFHVYIAKCSKNLVAPLIVPILQQSIALFIDITERSLGRETIETHQALLHGIESHDVFATHSAMTLHLGYNKAIIELCQKKELEEQVDTARP